MCKKNKPRVSIGLPVFNGEKFIAKTIDSLLSQTFTDFELIISDNASTDNTSVICKKYAEKDSRINYHKSDKNYGAAWNFNNVFKLSKGQYFKWAAHDDLHHPFFLQKCVDVLDNNFSITLCFTRTIFIDEYENELGEYKYPFNFTNSSRRERFMKVSTGGHIVHEIFGVIRTDILCRTALIGGYLGSDLVLLGKLALYGNFYQVPECLFLHREHPQRSMLAPQGAANFTQWFDSAKSGKYVMPHWRRFFENARTLIFHPMEFSEKMRCIYDLCRVANWQRRIFFGEITHILKIVWLTNFQWLTKRLYKN